MEINFAFYIKTVHTFANFLLNFWHVIVILQCIFLLFYFILLFVFFFFLSSSLIFNCTEMIGAAAFMGRVRTWTATRIYMVIKMVILLLFNSFMALIIIANEMECVNAFYLKDGD